MQDCTAPPLAEGIAHGGRVELDPNTVTPEGLKLLQSAFLSHELKIGEDRVRVRSGSCRSEHMSAAAGCHAVRGPQQGLRMSPRTPRPRADGARERRRRHAR